MKQSLYFRSIGNSLLGIFIGFCFSLALSYAWFKYAAYEENKVQTLIDVATQNPSIAQKIFIEAQKKLNGKEEMNIVLAENMNLYQRNLILLKEGGVLVDRNTIIRIHPIKDSSITGYVKNVERNWRLYRENAKIVLDEPLYVVKKNTKVNDLNFDVSLDDLETALEQDKETKVLNPKVKEAQQLLESKMPETLSLNQTLVGAYKIYLEKSKNLHIWIGYIFIIFNFTFLIVGLFLIKNSLIVPLHKVAVATEKIADGRSTEPIAFTKRNEIARIAISFNKMLENIRNATTFIKNIGQGNLEISYQGVNQENLLDKNSLAGALIEMREKMKSIVDEERERNWVSEGLAKFVEILRYNNNDTEALTYQIISNVVKYVNANQGGIFIINEDQDDPQAELVACYAYGRRKFLERQISMGEGLVGQVMREMDTIYITDVPEGYTDISSGLGKSTPKSILVVPLKLNEQIFGVIELASFEDFKPYQIAFIEKLGENIASTISNAKINERTQKLLEESNQIASQMRYKEDEMQQNVEEMRTIQEEMQRNEGAFTAQSIALNNTLLRLEINAEKQIEFANDHFLKKFKYNLHDLQQKELNSLLSIDSFESEMYERLWDSLEQGISYTDDFEFLMKDGQKLLLRSTFSPIKNQYGEIDKIIILAVDLTADKKAIATYKQEVDCIRRSNAVLEIDSAGKIIDANELFLNLVEYEKDNLIGQPYNVLLAEEDQNSAYYQALWQKLKRGEYEINEFKYVNKFGTIVWLQGSFNPIFDENQKLKKGVLIGLDVSALKVAN